MTILHIVTCCYALQGLTSDDMNRELNEDAQVKRSMLETILCSLIEELQRHFFKFNLT